MEISKLHASRIPLLYLNKLAKNFTRHPGNLFLNSMNMFEKFKLKQEIPNLELIQRLYDRFSHFLPSIEYITSHSDSAVYLVALGRRLGCQTHYESKLTILSKLFRKHAKHPILWSTPSASFYEARQENQFMKHAKHVNFLKHTKHPISWSASVTRARKAREHSKHVKHASI